MWPQRHWEAIAHQLGGLQAMHHINSIGWINLHWHHDVTSFQCIVKNYLNRINMVSWWLQLEVFFETHVRHVYSIWLSHVHQHSWQPPCSHQCHIMPDSQRPHAPPPQKKKTGKDTHTLQKSVEASLKRDVTGLDLGNIFQVFFKIAGVPSAVLGTMM